VNPILAAASLALFFALLAAFVYVLRRAARVVADTREDETFRQDGAALCDRAAAAFGEAGERIDRVRRRQDAPTALDEVLPAVQQAVEELHGEAGALAPPETLEPVRARLVEELERAGRAIEVVAHGCILMGVTAGRPRELEGETSVKRGYLNLLHAREALVTLAVDLRSGHTGGPRWFSERPRAG
jgi:hypothetical protein